MRIDGAKVREGLPSATRLRADREELHDRDLLALVGPRPDVDEEAAQVVAQEPRVAAADADAGQERRRAEEEHHQEIPGLRELQLLERAHVGPDEVDRQQVRQAEGPVIQKTREGPPARAGRERAMVTRRTTAMTETGGLGC